MLFPLEQVITQVVILLKPLQQILDIPPQEPQNILTLLVIGQVPRILQQLHSGRIFMKVVRQRGQKMPITHSVPSAE